MITVDQPVATHEELSRCYRRAQIIIGTLLMSAFGPYLVSSAGLRLEHFVIYPLALGIVTWLLVRPGQRIGPPSLLTSALLLILAGLWMLTVSLLSGDGRSTYAIVAGFENFIQPVALILVMTVVLVRRNANECRALLQFSIKLTIALLAINTVVSVAAIYADVWPFVRFFVGMDQAGSSVWERAASMGRYSGIFNQPLEAGIAYSIGLAGWVFLVAPARSVSLWMWVGGAALIVGGILSVSKVFIVGGLPLAIGYWFWVVGARFPLRVIRLVIAGVLSAVAMAFLSNWVGLGYFSRLFDIGNIADRGVIYLYTAGRFGEGETTVKRLFEQAWMEAPLHGFGFGAYSPIDNGYLAFFYQGGLVGLLMYSMILLIFGYVAVKGVMKKNDEGKLLVMLWIIILGASLGAPVLTINRASIFLWVFIAITMCIIAKGRHVGASGIQRML